jgi:ABC-2 type transport system permease protein
LRSQINKILAFTYRSYIFSKRNMYAFVELLFWPSVGAIQIGMLGIFLALTPEMKAFLLTGAIVSGALQVAQVDVAYGLLFDVWSKSLKQTFVTPIEHYHYILGSWLFGVCRGIIVFFALGGFCILIFKFYLPSPIITALSITGIFLSALVIGMCVIFVILYFGQRIVEVVWMITTLVMLICGIYYPVSMLPKALQYVAGAIPITYFLEYYRTGYGFKPVFAHPLIRGFGLSIFYIIVMFFMLDIAHKRARKTGMIIKLSE